MMSLTFDHVHFSINKGELSNGMTGLPRQMSSEPILNLFFDSTIPTIAQGLMGRGKCRPPRGAQIALRFPSPIAAPAVDARLGCVGGKRWHVDGFNQVDLCASHLPPTT